MKKLLTKLTVLVCVLATAAMQCGFTFVPSKQLDVSAGFTVNDGGTVAYENMQHFRKDWYGDVTRTVGGKTGFATLQTWGTPLLLGVDPAAFSGITSVRVSVEWYDAKHSCGDAEKFWRFRYMDTTGATPYTGWHGKHAKSETWKTETFEINNIDLSCTKTLYNGYPAVNLWFVPDKNLTDMGTADTSDDYYSILIHSIKIEPINNSTYDIQELYVPKALSWSADSAGTGVTWTTSSFKPDTGSAMSVTDKNGVAMLGKPSSDGTASGNPNSECYFTVDTAKFKDVTRANVTITYFDQISSNGNNSALKIRWPLRTSTGKWGIVDETDAGWTTKTGLWKTKVFTITNCDFTNPTIMSKYTPHSIGFYTAANLCDMNTDDTADDYYGLLIAKVEVTPIPNYTFTSLKFTDGANNEVSALTPGADLYSDLTVTKAEGDAEDVTVMMLLYDETTNKLLKASAQTKSVAAQTPVEFTNCFTAPSDAESKYVKIMVWDTLTGLVPISNKLICR